eukprot:10914091-Heterocapsa_arctica.AAC.1
MAPIVSDVLFGVWLLMQACWNALQPLVMDAYRNADHPCGCGPVHLFASLAEVVHVPSCEALMHDLMHGFL